MAGTICGIYNREKVLVIGAGPSGLSAAYHLNRMGHTVEIYEAGNHAGGLLYTGVPDYRLPKEILDFEIDRIVRTGVTIKLNYKVQDIITEKEAGNLMQFTWPSVQALFIKKI
ncbi:MAG: NAD(P)-binding protein [Chitinophagaceae bacterium]|nr:NAD(P)-binding protein [Chitinophagaceae bacterium]